MTTGRGGDSAWLAPLDGLRGISILMVLTAHLYTPNLHWLGGERGVTVFFVLSGFLITRLLIAEEREKGAVDLSGFYLRRAFRLFPVYYLVLAVYCALVLRPGGASHGGEFARRNFVEALPAFLLYFQELPFFRGVTPLSFYQSWSLGIEEKFYFVWPLLAFVALRTPGARMILAAAVIILTTATKIVGGPNYLFPYGGIAVGCLVAVAHTQPAWRKSMERTLGSWRAWGAVALWGALHIVSVWPDPDLAAVGVVLYPLPIAAVLVASLTSPTLGHVLSLSALTLLGKLSYGIYLVHLLARNAAEPVLRRAHLLNGVTLYAAMLGLSFALAWGLQRVVETPFREYGRRLAADHAARRAARAAGPGFAD